MKRVIPGEGRSLHRNSHVFSTIIIWLEHHVVKVKKKFYYKFRSVNFFKDLYLILIVLKSNIPTSQEYFPTLLRENNLNRI